MSNGDNGGMGKTITVLIFFAVIVILFFVVLNITLSRG